MNLAWEGKRTLQPETPTVSGVSRCPLPSPPFHPVEDPMEGSSPEVGPRNDGGVRWPPAPRRHRGCAVACHLKARGVQRPPSLAPAGMRVSK